MLVEAIITIAVAITIAYVILLFTRGNATYQGPSAIYDLSQENTMVLDNKTLPWSAEPCAIRFGIYIRSAPRTVEKVDCLDTQPPITQFKPSCSDYSYKMCECNATVCDRCAIGQTYLSKLLSVGDNLELWASGYTSQNDKPYIPAILKVKTAKEPTAYFVESISLPAIPLQGWTIITIVKEGRRFDVYYGSKQVASQMLTYLPVPPDGSRQWYAGNTKWQGEIGFFSAMRKSVSTQDVEKDVSALVNTRGVPFYIDQPRFSFNDFKNINLSCPGGMCNKLPEIKPLNPFAVYSSTVS